MSLRTEVIEIPSLLPPSAVLTALEARGREWRESTLPDSLRAAGAYGLGVDLRGTRFRLWAVSPARNPMRRACAGEVRAAASGGSLIAARRGALAPFSWGFSALWLAALLAAVVHAFSTEGGAVGMLVLATAAVLAGLGLAWVRWGEGRARQELDGLVEVLARVATGPSPPGAPAAGEPREAAI